MNTKTVSNTTRQHEQVKHDGTIDFWKNRNKKRENQEAMREQEQRMRSVQRGEFDQESYRPTAYNYPSFF